jgi:hypothetical protein
MRVSWRQLPPLTTHALAFLAGTLVLKPQASSRVQAPRHILVPLDRGSAGLPARDGYWLVRNEGQESCQILPQEVKVWRPEGEKGPLFVVIPRDDQVQKTLKDLLSRSAKTMSLSILPKSPCHSSERVRYD